MYGWRMAILGAVVCGIGVNVALLRVEQARCAARIQNMRLQHRQLQQQLNRQQLIIARLRAPAQITRRVEMMNLQVYAPGERPAIDDPEAHGLYKLASQ